MTILRAGTDTGSFINHIHSRATRGQPEPVKGLGVTFLGWTDRNPGTIQEVFTQGAYRYIACTSDEYKRTDDNGFSECQSYEYTERPDGHRSHFRQKVGEPDSAWEGVSKGETGRWKKNRNALRIGEREKYHDFSF